MRHRDSSVAAKREGVPAPQLARLRDLIAEWLGLHFPEKRLADFEQGITRALGELGFDSVADGARHLLSSAPTGRQLDVLARYLTIGETYFFRDAGMFRVLADDILPGLIHARRGNHQRLRLWSAGCSSGEEAYSLAILVHRALPDLRDWDVTILATDINPAVLEKARAGVYGEWSFRGVPPAIKKRYFAPAGDRRYTLREDLRKLVTFERLNLAADTYPSPRTTSNAMDVILCRNVLMYLTVSHVRAAVRRLRDALVGGGWLIVSASEMSQDLFEGFTSVNFSDAILYRKTTPAEIGRTTAARNEVAVWTPPEAEPVPPGPTFEEPPAVTQPPWLPAASLYERGCYGDAVAAILHEDPQPRQQDRLSMLVRALANEGKLAEALSWAHRWIEAHKLDSAAYYLRAVVLSEQDRVDEARQSFQQAVYLEPDFVLAHFALATLARRLGRSDEADRHYANALRILARLEPDHVVPESDGLTAARMTETILAQARHG